MDGNLLIAGKDVRAQLSVEELATLQGLLKSFVQHQIPEQHEDKLISLGLAVRNFGTLMVTTLGFVATLE